ncbi:hypothetical protein CEUSTIGMA_g1063.t1 [Chlamydomonas eustigma]|uniref:SANT domain-containing protein n=1 Tax=Chlamydomonas eustigma TaxID=1157962 RepID=A0A250WSG2_9CHLO|nr:hypothetical protein CEUSTIGMA_g1063.t1 [Chlamydomonas eustigma]|eukprot:GAX73612.1 hypothetical protein CEUSTIGMA_g1063.t1 [Chlamydomonas eustigma]
MDRRIERDPPGRDFRRGPYMGPGSRHDFSGPLSPRESSERGRGPRGRPLDRGHGPYRPGPFEDHGRSFSPERRPYSPDRHAPMRPYSPDRSFDRDRLGMRGLDPGPRGPPPFRRVEPHGWRDSYRDPYSSGRFDSRDGGIAHRSSLDRDMVRDREGQAFSQRPLLPPPPPPPPPPRPPLTGRSRGSRELSPPWSDHSRDPTPPRTAEGGSGAGGGWERDGSGGRGRGGDHRNDGRLNSPRDSFPAHSYVAEHSDSFLSDRQPVADQHGGLGTEESMNKRTVSGSFSLNVDDDSRNELRLPKTISSVPLEPQSESSGAQQQKYISPPFATLAAPPPPPPRPSSLKAYMAARDISAPISALSRPASFSSLPIGSPNLPLQHSLQGSHRHSPPSHMAFQRAASTSTLLSDWNDRAPSDAVPQYPPPPSRDPEAASNIGGGPIAAGTFPAVMSLRQYNSELPALSAVRAPPSTSHLKSSLSAAVSESELFSPGATLRQGGNIMESPHVAGEENRGSSDAAASTPGAAGVSQAGGRRFGFGISRRITTLPAVTKPTPVEGGSAAPVEASSSAAGATGHEKLADLFARTSAESATGEAAAAAAAADSAAGFAVDHSSLLEGGAIDLKKEEEDASAIEPAEGHGRATVAVAVESRLGPLDAEAAVSEMSVDHPERGVDNLTLKAEGEREETVIGAEEPLLDGVDEISSHIEDLETEITELEKLAASLQLSKAEAEETVAAAVAQLAELDTILPQSAASRVVEPSMKHEVLLGNAGDVSEIVDADGACRVVDGGVTAVDISSAYQQDIEMCDVAKTLDLGTEVYDPAAVVRGAELHDNHNAGNSEGRGTAIEAPQALGTEAQGDIAMHADALEPAMAPIAQGAPEPAMAPITQGAPRMTLNWEKVRALKAASLHLHPASLEKALLAVNRAMMENSVEDVLQLLPDDLSKKARTLGPGSAAFTLYNRPCEVPGWEAREKVHALQSDTLRQYLSLRCRLVEAKRCAQAGEYERHADHLKKHLVITRRREGLLHGATSTTPSGRGVASGAGGGGRSASRNAGLHAGMVKSDYEEKRIMNNFQAVEILKNMCELPNLMLDPWQRRWRAFDNRNGIQPEPDLDMLFDRGVKAWTEEEKQTFMEKFLQYPKDFGRIASYLPNRSAGDCVAFFYKHQKLEEFAAVRRKQQLKKRRVQADARKQQYAPLVVAPIAQRALQYMGDSSAVHGGSEYISRRSSDGRGSRGVQHRDLLNPGGRQETQAAVRGARLRPSGMEDVNDSMSSPPPSYNLWEASEEEGFYDPKAARAGNSVSNTNDADVEDDAFASEVETGSRRKPNRIRSSGYSVAEDRPAPTMYNEASAMRALYPLMSTKEILAQELLLDHEQQQHLHLALQQQQRAVGGGSGVKQAAGPKGRKGHSGAAAATATAAEGGPVSHSPAAVEGGYVFPVIDPTLPLFSPANGQNYGGTAWSVKPNALDLHTLLLGKNNVSVPQQRQYNEGMLNGPPQVTTLPLEGINLDMQLPPGYTQDQILNLGSFEQSGRGGQNVGPEVLMCLNASSIIPSLQQLAVNGGSNGVSRRHSGVDLEGNGDLGASLMEGEGVTGSGGGLWRRKGPSFWSAEEKTAFLEVFKVHGRDWGRLATAVPTKSLTQIKTYYQNYKSKLGKEGGDGSQGQQQQQQQSLLPSGGAEGAKLLGLDLAGLLSGQLSSALLPSVLGVRTEPEPGPDARPGRAGKRRSLQGPATDPPSHGHTVLDLQLDRTMLGNLQLGMGGGGGVGAGLQSSSWNQQMYTTLDMAQRTGGIEVLPSAAVQLGSDSSALSNPPLNTAALLQLLGNSGTSGRLPFNVTLSSLPDSTSSQLQPILPAHQLPPQQQQQQLTFLSPSLTHGLLSDMSSAQRYDATQQLLSNLLNNNGSSSNMSATGGFFRFPIQQQQQQQQQQTTGTPNQLWDAMQSSTISSSLTAPSSSSRPSLVGPQQLLMLQQLLNQSDRGLGSMQDATDRSSVLSAAGKTLNLATEPGAQDAFIQQHRISNSAPSSTSAPFHSDMLQKEAGVQRVMNVGLDLSSTAYDVSPGSAHAAVADSRRVSTTSVLATDDLSQRMTASHTETGN